MEVDEKYNPKLYSWEYPIGDPRHKDRDLETAPYDRQEQRVVNYLWSLGLAGGNDPIGFLIASHSIQISLIKGNKK